MEPVIIADYDLAWPERFAEIAGRVQPAFADTHFVSVEHIGSTAVPGLAAKPIIDLNVVVLSREDIPDAIGRLARLGYVHQGDLGILGREAFHSPSEVPAHYLYLCVADNAEHRRQVAFRDYLRANEEAADRYSALKRKLATQHGMDRHAYSEAKTEFIEAILAKVAAG